MTVRRLTVLSAGLAMAALMAVIALAPPAHAALGLRDTADAAPWTTNGIVYDQALSEDGETLYIGGKFTQVRPPAGTAGQALAVGRVAAIDVDTGVPIRTWNPNVTSNDGTTPVVRSLAAKNGRVYIGGSFTTVGGQARRNLAAGRRRHGALDPNFSANVGTDTSVVYALAADAYRLYVGGTFASVNETNRGNLAAANPSTGVVDAAWRRRANNVVRELEFGPNNDGTIFAVGGFKNVTGSDGQQAARQSVARLVVATGNVHPWAIPAGQVQTDSSRNDNMTCRDATVTQSRIFVGCGLGPNFSAAFRLDNADSGDRVWQTGFGGNPQASAMSPDGTRLIVGGHFGINPIKQQVCGKPLGGLIASNPENGAIDCSSNWVPHLDQNKDPSYEGAWSHPLDRQVRVGRRGLRGGLRAAAHQPGPLHLRPHPQDRQRRPQGRPRRAPAGRPGRHLLRQHGLHRSPDPAHGPDRGLRLGQRLARSWHRRRYLQRPLERPGGGAGKRSVHLHHHQRRRGQPLRRRQAGYRQLDRPRADRRLRHRGA
jgi:hypothetical protein